MSRGKARYAVALLLESVADLDQQLFFIAQTDGWRSRPAEMLAQSLLIAPRPSSSNPVPAALDA